MLKNKMIGRKIRNIVILLMAIVIMIGTYKYIDRSKAENIIEIGAIALDNYGYLANEEFTLEAKQLDDDTYEVELPECINTKKINRIVKIGLGNLEDTTTESTETILEDGLEILENRIYLTKEQIENEQINIEIEYDVKEENETLYNRILKYENEESNKQVEVKGYLPLDAEIQVEEVSKERITQILENKKVEVAYDIKILQEVVTEVPADEADPNAEPTKVTETIEVNPEDFGETCEVTIKDANIVENSQVYHVKEDNSYEQVNIIESVDGSVSFEAKTFSIYAVSSGEATSNVTTDEDELIPDEGTALGADTTPPQITYTYNSGDINKSANTVKVVFTVTDENFSSSSLAVTDITATIGGKTVDWTKVTRQFTSVTDVTTPAKGKQYTLLLSNVEQTSIASGNSFADYSGYVTVTIPAGKVSDTAGNTNEAKTITVGTSVAYVNTGSALPSTDYTTPYLPTDYTYVEGDLDSGIVIADPLGNQYVWVEVPRTTSVYSSSTLALDLDSLSGEDLTDAYDAIETDLHTYTSTYRNGTACTDVWYSEAQHGFASANDYNALKYKMLKSVFKNGGFYVGRYEAGIADTEPDVVDTNHEARTASGDATQTPVIQANAYPYNYVTNKQAQELAESFATEGYTTSLMFGVQWDLVLKHLEVTGAATTAELKSDSTEWGNYYNNTYSTNANGKYSTDYGKWTDGAYNKTASGSVLLSTGASTEFERGGIYDLAGNVEEWTLEYAANAYSQCPSRGSQFRRRWLVPAS